MIFPFRVKEYRDTKKREGYMYVFESQLGQELPVYVKNENHEEMSYIYSLGSVHRLDVKARNGSNGPELFIDLPGVLSDDYLF